ncbi:hypothetical protein GC177_09630 [bacterium]|nr:hypothetical protein [bacterium]
MQTLDEYKADYADLVAKWMEGDLVAHFAVLAMKSAVWHGEEPFMTHEPGVREWYAYAISKAYQQHYGDALEGWVPTCDAYPTPPTQPDFLIMNASGQQAYATYNPQQEAAFVEIFDIMISARSKTEGATTAIVPYQPV